MYLTKYITHLGKCPLRAKTDSSVDPTIPEIMNVFGFTYVFSSMLAQEGKSSEEGQVI